METIIIINNMASRYVIVEELELEIFTTFITWIIKIKIIIVSLMCDYNYMEMKS